MIKPSITKLITEMQEVKQEYASLEIADVLKIFEIDSLNKLTEQIRQAK